jgi:hypothetical protein
MIRANIRSKFSTMAAIGLSGAWSIGACVWSPEHGRGSTPRDESHRDEQYREASSEDAGPCAPGMAFVNGGMLWRTPIHDFCLDLTEVPVQDYQKCVDLGGCTVPSRVGWVGTYPMEGVRVIERRETYPVVGVTWLQARKFCEWRRARLPSMDEWTWAARGRDEWYTNPWGNHDDPLAPCQNAIDMGPCPTMANPRDVTRDGIFDMAGNVSEWSNSQLGDGRVYVMGGHHGVSLGSTFSYKANPEIGRPVRGFRCALELPEIPP